MRNNHMTVPAGLTAGDTFQQAGRELVVIKTPETNELHAVEMVHALNPAEIDPHPLNRKWFSAEGMKELVDSIRVTGQTTPGIVRRKADGRYELIAGERRWKACAELGLRLQAMVREMGDSAAVEVLLIENAKREGLRPVDEAEIYDAMLQLRDEQGQKIFTLERIAERVHGEASRANVMRVSRMHKLLQLPAQAAQALNDGAAEMSLVKAFLVARIADAKDREKAAAAVMTPDKWTRKVMTVKEADEHIRNHYQVSLKGWSEHMKRLDLLSDAQKNEMGFTGVKGETGDGSCANCPWLAKNNPAFADCLSSTGGKKDAGGETGIEPNTCTRARCHALKLETLWQSEGAEFQKKQPKTERVLSLKEIAGNDFVDLKGKPSGSDTGVLRADQPTWEKLIKGQGVPVLVGRNVKGEACLMVHKKTALAAGRETMPEIFSKAAIKTADMLPEERKKHEAAEKLKKEREALDRKIEDEVKREALVALHEVILKKGLGIEGRRVLAQAVGRSMNITQTLEALTGKEVMGDGEKALEKHLVGKTQHEIDAIIVLLAVWEDVYYSNMERAEDFQEICKCVNVDLKAVAKGVREKLQAEAKTKAAAQAAKNPSLHKATKGKGPSKNSSDPNDVSSAKEASKTAAADARAKQRTSNIEVTDAHRAFYAGKKDCTINHIQVKFKLGYGRASAIFDQLVDEKASSPKTATPKAGPVKKVKAVKKTAKKAAKPVKKKSKLPAADDDGFDAE